MRRCIVVLVGLVFALSAIVSGASSGLAYPMQGPQSVFFPQTGHTLSNGFLNYWQSNGGVATFGYPITQEISQNGLTVQYFERAVFEYHPNAPVEQQVQLRLLGTALAPSLEQQLTLNQQHYAYIATAYGISMPDPPDPFQPAAANTLDQEHTFFPETGHNLSNGFYDFWAQNGGLPIFGYPLSEEYTDLANGLTTQVFQRAIFQWDATNQQVQVELLGTQAAQQNGVNTAPVTKSNTPTYSPSLFTAEIPSDPAQVTTPIPGSPDGYAKWIEVDLTHQYLRAWEGNKLVFSQYISAGLSDTPTPVGLFHVYVKLPFDEMKGGTPGKPDYYDLPNVPNVMYFLQGGYAIHGAYWHANFGTPISHGCVNMTLDGAAWMYQWTPIGTPVWIHY